MQRDSARAKAGNASKMRRASRDIESSAAAASNPVGKGTNGTSSSSPFQ
jgi:hypothetical protein